MSVRERARAQTLDEEFQVLYREHFAFVWRMLLHFGVPTAEIEDACQDVFIVVHRRLGDLSTRSSPRTWLYEIARRVAADHRRAGFRRQRKLDALGEPGKQIATPAMLEQQFVVREQIDALERILARLDPRLREVFLLADVEGMTAREIGEVLQLNPNTVSARLRRARAAVDRALDRLESRTREMRRLRHD